EGASARGPEAVICLHLLEVNVNMRSVRLARPVLESIFAIAPCTSAKTLEMLFHAGFLLINLLSTCACQQVVIHTC
ncbi:hypothetical protein BU25DRAFT_339932, partial [Macroventuria anomochaeta]